MPFKSDAQRKFMYARHPGIAKRWQKHTPEGDLPEHVEKKGSIMTAYDFGVSVAMNKSAAPVAPGFFQAIGQAIQRLGVGKGYTGARNIRASLAGSIGPRAMAGEIARRQGHIGMLGTGAAAAGAGGLGYALSGGDKTASDQAVGTPFMDGFLSFCVNNNLDCARVADLLEKGAQVQDRTGQECRSFIDKLVK